MLLYPPPSPAVPCQSTLPLFFVGRQPRKPRSLPGPGSFLKAQRSSQREGKFFSVISGGANVDRYNVGGDGGDHLAQQMLDSKYSGKVPTASRVDQELCQSGEQSPNPPMDSMGLFMYMWIQEQTKERTIGGRPCRHHPVRVRMYA